MALRAEVAALHPENLDTGTFMRLRSKLITILEQCANSELESASTSEILAQLCEILEVRSGG
jgi:hypothetical protein